MTVSANPGDTVLVVSEHRSHIVDHMNITGSARMRCGLLGLLAADQSHACLAGTCKACLDQPAPQQGGTPCP